MDFKIDNGYNEESLDDEFDKFINRINDNKSDS